MESISTVGKQLVTPTMRSTLSATRLQQLMARQLQSSKEALANIIANELEEPNSLLELQLNQARLRYSTTISGLWVAGMDYGC